MRLQRVIGLVAMTLALLYIPPAGQLDARATSPCDPPISNPVACENAKPGNPPADWNVSKAGDASLQGFATDISVNKGDTISFKVNTTASSYKIDIFRMGYYGGLGARRIVTIQPSAALPQTQPACLTDPTGLIDCGNWAVSASWTVPADAVSGIYNCVLTRLDTGGTSQMVFVVRDDASTSDVLFQTSDTTWQAYNKYGGNSLYAGTAPQSSDGRAYKVSYNRPFTTRGDAASNFVFYGEYPMVRFLEANGYNVSYFTDVDSDRRGALIRNHKVFLSVGHDEYWSGGQRANVEAARAAGVNLAFFSGNEVFWKTRWEVSTDGSGTPYRTLVCYKETKPERAIDPLDPPTWTGTWRDPTLSPPADGGRPENALTGTIFTVNRGSSAITVPAAFSKLRLWRNTAVASLGPGQTATLGADTLGYEWDEDLDNGARPAGLVRMSSTTVNVPERLIDYGNTYAAGTATHSLTLYRYPGGGLVFAAGTVQWAWGLDSNHDTGPDTGGPVPDQRMQQATINLMADLGAQPATLQAGLVAAAASTDATAPLSTITSPSSGASLPGNSTVTISGTAADAGGGVVGGVEISVDGGGSWHPAAGTTSWTYSWTTGRPGPVTIKSRAADDSGNLELPSAGVAVTIAGSTAPAFLSRSTVQNGRRVSMPAGVLAGDVMLALLEVDTHPVTVTSPPGWTLLLDTPAGIGTSAAFHGQIWYKVATSNEPSAYDWSTGTAYTDIAVFAYINVNRSSPIDMSDGRDAGVTATPTTSSITTTAGSDMLVAAFINYNSGSFAAGSGMAQRLNFDSVTAQDAVQASVGPTGAKTATNSSSGRTSAQILALRPLVFDSQPPTVTMTAPAGSATVSGNAVPVSASATDNVGVSSVQFLLDGASLGSSLSSAPYAISWDSTTAENGSHTVSAQALDAAGNLGTATAVTVNVNNLVPPAITNVQVSSITASGATITWNTDVAADSQVEYGATSAYGSSTALDSALVLNHSQALTGLSAATTYHYRVKSKTGAGALATSGDLMLTTAYLPPVITNVQATAISSNGATITWTTDHAADSQVDYGTTPNYGASTTLDSALVLNHSEALTGLAPNTPYHYKVKSRDASNNLTASGDVIFTTAGAPAAIPVFRSRATVTNRTAVGAPAGVVAGDLLLAALEVDAHPVTVTGPAGWTLLLDTPTGVGTSSAFHAQIWYKVAGAGEPSSYQWTTPAGAYTDIQVLDYGNVDPIAPIDRAGGRDAGVTAAPTTDSINTTTANDMLVAVFIDYNTGSWTAGSGMTQRTNFDSNMAQDLVQTAAGASGVLAATNSRSGRMSAQVIALRGR